MLDEMDVLEKDDEDENELDLVVQLLLLLAHVDVQTLPGTAPNRFQILGAGVVHVTVQVDDELDHDEEELEDQDVFEETNLEDEVEDQDVFEEMNLDDDVEKIGADVLPVAAVRIEPARSAPPPCRCGCTANTTSAMAATLRNPSA